VFNGTNERKKKIHVETPSVLRDAIMPDRAIPKVKKTKEKNKGKRRWDNQGQWF